MTIDNKQDLQKENAQLRKQLRDLTVQISTIIKSDKNQLLLQNRQLAFDLKQEQIENFKLTQKLKKIENFL